MLSIIISLRSFLTNEKLIQSFIKFCAVGVSGMIIDFGITWLLKEKVKVNKFIANGIGFICAASSNYVLNRIWTFQSNSTEISREYTDFIIISLIGLGINTAIIYLLNEKLKLNFYISKITAIAVVTIWNFTMNYLYTF